MTEEISRIQRAIRSGIFRRGELAKLADVHRNTIRRAAGSDWTPSAATVEKLIAALDRIGP